MNTTTHNTTTSVSTKYKNTAVRIANYLAREAVWHEDRCNWIGHAVEAVNGNFQVVRKSFVHDFYNGSSGVAYFLSTLLRFHEDPILDDLLEGTVNQMIHIQKQDSVLGTKFGFYGGLLGVAFTLRHVGKEQNRPDWVSQGEAMLDDICQSPIEDHELDIIAGAAGAIPIFLQLYREDQKNSYLETAIRLGDFLVEKAEKNPTTWGWKLPVSSKYLTGYSHGNAGMALALLELYAVTQNAQYYTAAMFAFNYERMTYNPTVQNWPDLREIGQVDTGTPIYGETWCHGAPGIAMSRIRAWQLTGDNSFLQEAEAALSTTYKNVYNQLTQGRDTANFSLCHGIAGNADILLHGTQFFQNPTFAQVVQQVGDLGIERHGNTGLNWYSGVNDPSGQTAGMLETPGMMLGLAGTGYFYLRLAFPDQVKSLLIL